MIAGLILLPKCELHRTAVFCPLPSTLRPVGGASDPKHGIPSSVELTQNKFICRLRGDRSQMTALLRAEIFGVIPVQSCCAPVVAVVPIFHPVFLAGFNAFFIFAFRAYKIDNVKLIHCKNQFTLDSMKENEYNLSWQGCLLKQILFVDPLAFLLKGEQLESFTFNHVQQQKEQSKDLRWCHDFVCKRRHKG